MTGGTSKASSTKKKPQESERKSTPSSASEGSAMYLTESESGTTPFINPPAVATTPDISSLTAQLQLLQQQLTALQLQQPPKQEPPLGQHTDVHTVINQQSVPTVTHQFRIELFGVPQHTSIGEAPKFTIDDRFSTWQQKIEGLVGIHGLDPLVTKPPEQSWNDALIHKPGNVPIPTLQQWYLQAGKRIVYAISLATIGAGLDRDQLFADARANKTDNGVVTLGSLRIDVDANPYLIMQTLRDKYDTKTPYAAISIWKKLLAARWDPSKEKGTKHLQNVRDLFMQLDRLVADDRPKSGECFGETMKAIILLNTLPSAFSTDVKILTTQDKITTSQVDALIRKYDDADLRLGKTSSHHAESANALTHSLTHPSTKNHRKKGKHSTYQSKDKREQRRSDTGKQERSSHRQRHSSDGSSSESDGSGSDPEDDIETRKERVMCLFGAPAAGSIARQHSDAAVLLDSAATRHVWNNTSAVHHQRDIKPTLLFGATGEPVTVTQKGRVQLTPTITLRGVIIAPTATANIMSVDRITEAGYNVSFYRKSAVIRDPHEGKVILHFKKENGLYVFHHDHKKPTPSPSGRVNRKNKAEGL
jgi:hypothetical protein